jgi:hypothetical protein
MSISTKIYLQPAGIIRRFTIEAVPFEQFDRLAKEAFGILNNGNQYQWQYQDDEDDWVSFSSEGEWKDALFFHAQSKSKVLRLRLTQQERTGMRRPVDNATTANQSIRHHGVVCDGCEMRGIVGIRHKCNVCDDFDFCSTCYNDKEKMQKHGNHAFQTIETPRRGCPAFRSFQENGDTVLHCPIKIENQDAKAVQEALSNALNQFGIDVEITSEEPKPEVKEEKPVEEVKPEPVQETKEVKPEPVQEIAKPEVKPEPQPVPVDMEQSWTFMEVQSDAKVEKPSAPVQPVEAYPQHMETLRMMGFENVALNRHLLNNYKGDLERVVGSLLQLTGYRS